MPKHSTSSGLVEFSNVHLVTPNGLESGELWIQEGGAIVDPQERFWQRSDTSETSHRRIDCQGMLLCPGMIDIMYAALATKEHP